MASLQNELRAFRQAWRYWRKIRPDKYRRTWHQKYQASLPHARRNFKRGVKRQERGVKWP